MDFQERTKDNLAENLLELALRCGADAAEVYQSKLLSRPVFFEANRIKQLETNQSQGTALRLWYKGRPGLTVAYGQIDPQDIVERAIALSYLNQPEAVELTNQNHCQYPDLGENVPIETLVEWANQSIDCIRHTYPEVICNGDWECDVESTLLINTNGLDCRYTDTTLSSYLSAEWVRGDDFLCVSDGQTQRGNLEPDKLAQQIIQRLNWVQSKNAIAPIASTPILFTAKAADMLWGTFQAALNGKRALEKSSPWAGKIGQVVTSDLLTIWQDPQAGPYSCPFDDEGTPTQPLVFIENGILKNFYCDRLTGANLHTTSTGNGFRPGLESYPTPGLFNFLIKTGTASLAELIANLDDGLIIDQMLGDTGSISGDFSINVDLGFRVKNGEVMGRIKDTMVSGNVYTALQKVIAIGNDGDWNGSCYTPSILVEGLSITSQR